MRQTCIFSGSSHPLLVGAICDRLGKAPDKVELRKFSNGETSVEIKTSVRDQDVFIVQSGSARTNDNILELLIMISACKGGSARSITAVMPYFPYSRQSKKKNHRGAITARMIANLLHVAGVNHVITIDLHASQSQGFFRCPIDNLIAEPLLARWIRNNVKSWQDAVVVSKNPGGTKRVTSLADALKLSFGIVMTDTRSNKGYRGMESSLILPSGRSSRMDSPTKNGTRSTVSHEPDTYDNTASPLRQSVPLHVDDVFTPSRQSRQRTSTVIGLHHSSNPSLDGTNFSLDSVQNSINEIAGPGLTRAQTVLGTTSPHPESTYESDGEGNEEFDERARDVVTGRLVHGHIVEDDHPSPAHPLSQVSHMNENENDEQDDPPEHMLCSILSTASSHVREHSLGGSANAGNSDEEEEEVLQDPERETTITLVGNVRDRSVFIIDDIIDKAGSWIAAAETVVKRGGATEVYCMATHGLFGDQALQEMQACKQIDKIVITNTFPIPADKMKGITKLVVLDVSYLLSEAIRRNHHGESISQLYMHQN